jgi:hypothetical protein
MYSSGADIVWSHVPHSPPSICIHIYLLYCIESYRHIYWLQLRKGWGLVKGRGVRGIKMDHDKRTFFRFFTYLWVFTNLYFLWFFWFIMYIPTVHDKFFALKIEIQYNCSTFLARLEYGGASPKILICVSRPRGNSKRMLVYCTYTCRVWNTLGCLQDSSDTNSLCLEDSLCYRKSLRTYGKKLFSLWS